jgi:hypothetical protein
LSEDHGEVDRVFATFVPAAGIATFAFDLMIREDVDFATEEALGLGSEPAVETVVDVEGDVRVCRSWKGVSVQADASSGSELGQSFVSGKTSSIVAGMVDFGGAGGVDAPEVQRACDGHEENVAVFALGPTKMKMAEAEDATAGDVTEARGTPVKALHIRAKLDHTEW